MTPTQLYAVGQQNLQNSYWKDGDYKDIKLGHDFNFDDVNAYDLNNYFYLNQKNSYIQRGPNNEGYYFSGATAINSTTPLTCTTYDNIKLFASNSPAFTLALDFQFHRSDANRSVLLSTSRGDDAWGLEIYTQNSNVYVRWGTLSPQQIGYVGLRDIVVIRHQANSSILNVYTSNNNSTNSFRSSLPTAYTMNVNTSTGKYTSNEPLSFGGVREASGSYVRAARGVIHWFKIWFADLGNTNAQLLASWPKETVRM